MGFYQRQPAKNPPETKARRLAAPFVQNSEHPLADADVRLHLLKAHLLRQQQLPQLFIRSPSLLLLLLLGLGGRIERCEGEEVLGLPDDRERVVGFDLFDDDGC